MSEQPESSNAIAAEEHYPSAASRAFGQDRAEKPAMKPAAQDKAFDLAKRQSGERRALSKKQGDAKRAAKTDAERATLRDNQAKERLELEEKQRAERAKDNPRGTIFNGLANQDAVEALHADLTALADEHHFEVGDIHTFGLEFDVFDPVTGQLTSPARAHRRDVGDIGILMTAEAVVSDIITARAHQATAGVTQYSADRTAVPA